MTGSPTSQHMPAPSHPEAAAPFFCESSVCSDHKSNGPQGDNNRLPCQTESFDRDVEPTEKEKVSAQSAQRAFPNADVATLE